MPEVQLIARYTIAPGNEDAVLDLLAPLVEASRAEPGCLSYDAYRRFSDARSVVLLERYASREALEAHRASPHFRTLVLEGIVPLLEERTVEEIEVRPSPTST